MLSKAFITAGRAIFTLQIAAAYAEEHKTPAHYTFRVNKKPDKYNPTKFVFWVSLLTGPDNTSNYTPMGRINPDTGEMKLNNNGRYTETCQPVKLLRRVLVNVWADTCQRISDAGFKLHHEGRCGRCGRLLTVPLSIETGIGPECANRMAA